MTQIRKGHKVEFTAPGTAGTVVMRGVVMKTYVVAGDRYAEVDTETGSYEVHESALTRIHGKQRSKHERA